MNNALMFSRATDEWATPREFFEALDAEFCFQIDASARAENTQCAKWYAPPMAQDFPGDGALTWPWFGNDGPGPYWLNPPYSKCRAFIAKAAAEAKKGATVVCLVYARTDTRWFHEHIYDAATNQYRPGVEVRFIKGRLKFGGSATGAPAPSMVVIFRPVS
jgi:phage N-6-adenine-methyltransferase